MQLNDLDRKRYIPVVTLDPPVIGTWQASFDGGATWIDGEALGDGTFGWLISGSGNNTGSPVFKMPAGLKQLIPLLGIDVGDERITVVGPFIQVPA